ncbi:aminotransferase class V-fold PLP-dependent enzyme [Streptomyces lavendulae]|uniref:aminotransferase class V-fold PLP-dependent enzyme n=1 Tax=Streptomyces TaxID=1883 RepID=UPI00247335C9|nr:aminotransferase class V-fold PLP-dependent enzyme [Streptomyces sp. SPB4]MDH6538083.1 cysteine desulfurase/selenocysteine lyase [Streptomyces sp. SPB4]
MMYETLDLARARAETPGVGHVVHLNNAGASLVPRPVVDVMTSYLRLESRVGPYEAAERSEGAFGNAHVALASLLNCSRQEVAVLDSATRAWGMAMSSVPLEAGDRVIISAVEYGSNYLSLLHLAERRGVSLEVAPADADGLVDVAGLEAMLDERVRLIAMVHVPMHDALVNPVAEVGRVARRHGIPYLVDACQSVGQMPIDVTELGCDLLVGTGRKFLRGPRGTGFLYVRQEMAHKLVPAIVGLDGVEWLSGTYRLAPGARRFETWETNAAARIGLGVAVDYALGWGIERTYERVRELAAGLRKDLVGMSGVVLHDRGRERCGTVTLSFEGRGEFEVRNALKEAGINTWVCLENAACVDMQQRGLSTLLRVSPHYYNSEQELERFCSVLEDILAGTRRERVFA